MITLAFSTRDLSLDELCSVYEEQIAQQGAIRWKSFDSEKQILFSQKEFIDSVYDFFFLHIGGYAIWQEEHYVCAMRFENYRDGFLISCLETAPQYRRNGFAERLVRDFIVVANEQNKPIYSHIAKGNIASIRLHQKCGFRECSNFAVLLDGTVSSRYSTFKKDSNFEK